MTDSLIAALRAVRDLESLLERGRRGSGGLLQQRAGPRNQHVSTLSIASGGSEGYIVAREAGAHRVGDVSPRDRDSVLGRSAVTGEGRRMKWGARRRYTNSEGTFVLIGAARDTVSVRCQDQVEE